VPKSTRKPRRRKSAAVRPAKPYSEFPLSPHPSGMWQKKINGRIYYFGRWGKILDGEMQRLPDDGWQTALALYKAQIDDIQAGKTPRARIVNGQVVKEDGRLTVGDLGNRFYTAKVRAMEAGELSPRMLAEYTATTDRLASVFGKSRLIDDPRPRPNSQCPGDSGRAEDSRCNCVGWRRCSCCRRVAAG